jgi:FkbM family methyltransferase
MTASFIARVLNKLRLINRYKSKDIFPISRFNMSFRIKLNESVFNIPIIHKTGWENLFLTDGWFTGLLNHLKIRKDWTVIDIGANIGQTLLKIKSFDKEINYIGFEPNPVCVNYLYKLILQNSLIKTVLYPVGISDKTQLLNFFYFSDSETDPSASIIPDYRPVTQIMKTNVVPVFDINEIPQVKELTKIDLIKIDVEGSEFEVLLSCEEIIKKHRPFIIIEILPVYSKDNEIRRLRQEKIEELIIRLNYRIFLIKKGINENFSELEKKDTIGIHGNIIDIDYLLAPADQVNRIN